MTSAAGIVLAGGRATRMGADKALLQIEGETMLARTVRLVSGVVSEVVIVGRTALPPELAATPAIRDAHGDAGPLGGIATGLAHVRSEPALVVACDLPFLQTDLLELLLTLAPGYDAVVPRLSERERTDRAAEGATSTGRASGRQAREPAPTTGDPEMRSDSGRQVNRSGVRVRTHATCAVYGQSCLTVMESRLAQGRYRLRDVLDALRVRWVDDDEVRRVDPEGRSFLNANTPQDWRELMHAFDRQASEA